jgi:uncharacterized protein YhaN
MKLHSLELRAFGSLRDVRLDFADDAPRLHVIYGPNEAGKSTALRALRGLFFGIAPNTRDAHSIKPVDLRVAALLCDSEGRQRYVVRRKGLKDTLRSEDDKTPLSAEEVLWVTAGMHASTFESQFGLSFDTLHRGAEELLGSGGDLGQSLFAAAVNGGQVRRVLEQLEAEAEALFRKKGVKMPLNVAIAQFEQSKRESRELATRADVFEQQQSEVEAAEAACAELNRQLSALRAERAKLERVKNLLPLLSRQRARQAERDALGQVARLPEEASLERKRAMALRRDAQVRLEQTQAELARIEHNRRALEQQILPALVAMPISSAEQLRDRLSLYRDAQRKLPSRKDALARAQRELERARAALQLNDADAHTVERLRLPKNLEVRAREQLRKGELLRADVLTERRKLDDLRHQLEQAQKKLWQLWAAKKPERQLSLLSRSEPPRAAALTEELCRHFEQRFEKIEQKQRDHELKRQGLEEQLAQNEQARAELSRLGEPPSEADLARCREQRDGALQQLRDLLIAHPDDARAVAYVERALALNAHADGLADHMRREADRVAAVAQLAATRATLGASMERTQHELDRLAVRAQKTQNEWAEVFHSAGLIVRLPRDALRLLGSQRDLDVQCEQLQLQLASQERAHRAVVAAERTWFESWSELAQALDLGSDPRPPAQQAATSTAELEALLSARTELLSRYDAAQALERELAATLSELQLFEQQSLQLCAAHMPELADATAEVAAERLITAHQRTHAALRQIQQATDTTRAREQAAQDAQRELDRAELQLQQLMRAAGVDDPAALEEAERRSARAQDLDIELAKDATDLAAHAEGQDAEALVAEVGLTGDQIRVRVAEIDDEYKLLDDRRLEQTEQLASKRLGLERLHEKHQAGDAAGDAALQLEEVRELTERYAQLRLAASLLKREIAHYRERHRGPVLDKAAEWFRQLTINTFSGLDVDYDDAGQPVLQCVRSDSQHSRLGVQALSTGTRDQLFLALRLASIEHLGTQRELMPLILDDILVQFDDGRARAALSALAEFAATTQVIFFTHHEHLCELAKEVVPSERLQILRLPQATVTTQLLLAPS